MKNILYSLLLCFAGLLPAHSQSFNPVLAGQLQHQLDSIRAAQNMKGISATVYLPGQGYWNGTSGESHAGVPITPDMLFGIASNSKLFTAVCILKLQENQMLNVDDSLHEWLPAYPNIDSNITIRQLLNHTSGLRDINEYPGYPQLILGDPTHVFTNEERMQLVGPPLFAAGADWSYSNTNYIIAGMIVESATGRPFVEFLRDSILAPLGLDSTFLDVYEPLEGTVAHPWNGSTDISGTPRTSLNSAAWTAGGMYSTSLEMAQWYKAVFLDHFLTPGSLHELTTFVGSGNYGMGVAQQFVNGDAVWSHGGEIRGYRSVNMFDPETGIIVNAYINQIPANAVMLAAALLRTVKNISLDVSEEDAQSAVSLFPNPAGEQVWGGPAAQGMVLHDCLGRFCLETSGSVLSLSGLPAGTYVVSILTEGKVVSKKLIKR